MYQADFRLQLYCLLFSSLDPRYAGLIESIGRSALLLELGYYREKAKESTAKEIVT
jgi:hypothetical protein